EPEKEQTQGRQEEGSAIKNMQNEIIPTLMSHHPKLKLSLFHTHFVLQKTVKFTLPNAMVAGNARGTTYHNKS
ncbi:MAG TPA: hypothetical protein PLZ21_11685, partial [Armatimonadota bacterium]|nr:hypothetical protein [Armatimonadota bacterium]